MAVFFFVLGILSFISWAFTGLAATTIFQQIVGGISLVICSIFFIGAGIVNSLDKIHAVLKTKTDNDPLRVFSDSYKCKYCKEVIRKDDKICPYCKEPL